MKALVICTLTISLGFASARGQQQPARTDAAPSPEVSFAATSALVTQPGSPVNIRVLRWSTDEERRPVVAALNPAPAVAAPANPPSTEGDRSGGARAGRGGRGGGRGGRGTPNAPLTPTAALTAAIGRAPTLGYIWTNDVTGYAIKYAHRLPLPDGGERIILATNRRLGAHVQGWTPVAAEALTDYEFTLIELRLDSRGLGEGKTSLTTKVIVDDSAKTVALENYAAAPPVLQNVKRSS
jgi:hypothetical protein